MDIDTPKNGIARVRRPVNTLLTSVVISKHAAPGDLDPPFHTPTYANERSSKAKNQPRLHLTMCPLCVSSPITRSAFISQRKLMDLIVAAGHVES